MDFAITLIVPHLQQFFFCGGVDDGSGGGPNRSPASRVTASGSNRNHMLLEIPSMYLLEISKPSTPIFENKIF